MEFLKRTVTGFLLEVKRRASGGLSQKEIERRKKLAELNEATREAIRRQQGSN